MSFLAYAFLWFVFFIAAELLRPKPEFVEPVAAGIEDFSFPTATEGRSIPVIYGQVQMAAPNVVWYGQLEVVARKKKVQTGMFSEEKIITHYDYYFSIHMVLCMREGVKVQRIWMNDTEIHTGGNNSTFIAPLDVNNPTTYMVGTNHTDEYDGTAGKVRANNENFASQIWELPQHSAEALLHSFSTEVDNTDGVPGWVGTSGLYMRNAFVGRSPNIRPLKFEIAFPGEEGGVAPIDIIQDLMTNSSYGMGKSLTQFDTASYAAAAATLATEGFVMNMIMTHQDTFETLVGDVLRHIDAVQYVSPVTGLFTIKLIRNDYTLGAIPILDESNISTLSSFSRGTWEETTNEVKVTYVSRENGYKKGVAIAQDMASWKSQDQELVAVTQLFGGIYDADLASQIAQRGLNNLSKTLARCEITVNRLAHSLNPGDVFELVWSPLTIVSMVMRVISINYGTLQDGTILITCVEDAFHLEESLYASPPATGWVEVATSPIVSPFEDIMEAPYYFVAPDTAFGSDFTQGKYVSLASTIPAGLFFDTHSKLAADPVGEYVLAETEVPFLAHALLDAAVGKADLTITIKSVDDLTNFIDYSTAQLINGICLIKINDEFVEYETLTDNLDNTYTLEGVFWRGLADTVPGVHAENDDVWFIGYEAQGTANVYAETTSVTTRYLTATNSGQIPIEDASDNTFTFDARAHRPYPPANFRINTLYYPTGFLDTDITLDWNHRDRSTTPRMLRDHREATDYGPEAGVTYTLRIYGETSNLLRTEVGITAKTYLYDLATEVADSWPAQTGRRNVLLTFELESVRAGYTSWKLLTHTVARSPIEGYGTDYGEIYGGV